MPHYFFHTLQGEPTHDGEGEDLAGPREAHRCALRVMGEIIRDVPAGFLDTDEFSVVCMDIDSAVVVALSICRNSPADAAAMMDRINAR